ncbi:MAG: hypothetical protein RLZZ09_3151 [Pseudomonadota bacterium]
MEAEPPKDAVPLDQSMIAAIMAVLGEGLGQTMADAVFAGELESSIADRVVDRTAHVECRRQSSLESIFRSAATVKPGDIKSTGHLDSGWLGLFVSGAQDAENELEREVWSRIFAAEVQAPGTVARRTLNSLRELDVWELEAFAEYVAFAFAFESGWRFMFEEDIARREMWSYGREIDITQHWLDIGLLSPQVSTIESLNLRGLCIGYKAKRWQLSAMQANEGSAAVELESKIKALKYRKFTAMGQQIANATPSKTFNGYARNVVQALNGLDGFRFDVLEETA